VANGQSIRADNVGSILRPPELLEARQAHADGKLSREQLTAVEDKAILDVLQLQRSIGMDVVTDGEYRRDSWLTGIQDAVEGSLSRIDWLNGRAPAVDSSRCLAAWWAPNCSRRDDCTRTRPRF
jgi:methionine synthase II (cobalamin-independent)